MVRFAEQISHKSSSPASSQHSVSSIGLNLKRSASEQSILVALAMPTHMVSSQTNNFYANCQKSPNTYPTMPTKQPQPQTACESKLNLKHEVKILDENNNPIVFSSAIENLDDLCRYLRTEDVNGIFIL